MRRKHAHSIRICTLACDSIARNVKKSFVSRFACTSGMCIALRCELSLLHRLQHQANHCYQSNMMWTMQPAGGKIPKLQHQANHYNQSNVL